MKFLLTLLLFVSISSGQTPDDLHSWVRGIEGRDPQGRREFVKKELDKLGVAYTTEPFSRTGRFGNRERTITGENIVVTTGAGTKSIVVGAHLDAVPGSPGANDNGGGVAVLLGLVRWSASVPWNHRVRFCFFDQEEMGLIGSQEFVKTYADSSAHLAMINLDVEGMGEAVYVGPVGGGDDDLIMPVVRTAAGKLKVPFFESEHYPPSDHRSFGRRGLENISVSVVPSADVPLLIEAVAGGWQLNPDRMPEVMKFMHTPRDSAVYVSKDALDLSFRFMKAILARLNALGTTGPR
ncbi:MAG: hypothetical protein HBSIN02_21620 [Bacteroidia bacterium]|nr:MAG: hypothetical protein HBSIN02_21620 [Bacteroidia bacterium]